jgi:hypothetical protein
MTRLICLASVLFLSLVSTTWSQELAQRITNKDVIDMVAMGLSDDIIIAKIRSASAGRVYDFRIPE